MLLKTLISANSGSFAKPSEAFRSSLYGALILFKPTICILYKTTAEFELNFNYFWVDEVTELGDSEGLKVGYIPITTQRRYVK